MARGRPKKIESPEILWEHFLAYKTQVKNNPFIIKDWVGKDAGLVYREKERCLTTEGFENFLSDEGIIEELGDYFKNKENRYSEFAPICIRIKKSIRQDQIEGGMSGVFNTSITQRLNNLVEKTETKDVSEPKKFIVIAKKHEDR